MYPSVMFTVAITVMVFMLIKVVPVFAKMYDGMGIALPAATAGIMAASDFMRGTGGLMTFLIIAGTITSFRRYDFKIFIGKGFVNYGKFKCCGC